MCLKYMYFKTTKNINIKNIRKLLYTYMYVMLQALRISRQSMFYTWNKFIIRNLYYLYYNNN